MKEEFADCPAIEYLLRPDERLCPVAKRSLPELVFRDRIGWQPGSSREVQSIPVC